MGTFRRSYIQLHRDNSDFSFQVLQMAGGQNSRQSIMLKEQKVEEDPFLDVESKEQSGKRKKSSAFYPYAPESSDNSSDFLDFQNSKVMCFLKNFFFSKILFLFYSQKKYSIHFLVSSPLGGLFRSLLNICNLSMITLQLCAALFLGPAIQVILNSFCHKRRKENKAKGEGTEEAKRNERQSFK